MLLLGFIEFKLCVVNAGSSWPRRSVRNRAIFFEEMFGWQKKNLNVINHTST